MNWREGTGARPAPCPSSRDSSLRRQRLRVELVRFPGRLAGPPRGKALHQVFWGKVVRELRITGRAAERSQARKRWPLIRARLSGGSLTHARTACALSPLESIINFAGVDGEGILSAGEAIGALRHLVQPILYGEPRRLQFVRPRAVRHHDRIAHDDGEI